MDTVLTGVHIASTLLTVYRTPPRPPRGAWAQHLNAARRARDLSQTAAFELVREGLGLGPKSRASYVAIDEGRRQPRPAEAAYLASVFGWPPTLDPDHPVEEPEPADLATLIRALNALVQELHQVAEGQVGMGIALGQLATLALELRGLPGLPSELPLPPDHGGSAPASGPELAPRRGR